MTTKEKVWSVHPHAFECEALIHPTQEDFYIVAFGCNDRRCCKSGHIAFAGPVRETKRKAWFSAWKTIQYDMIDKLAE